MNEHQHHHGISGPQVAAFAVGYLYPRQTLKALGVVALLFVAMMLYGGYLNGQEEAAWERYTACVDDDRFNGNWQDPVYIAVTKRCSALHLPEDF